MGALMGRPERRVRVLHGRTYIPLALAPFHEAGAAMLVALRRYCARYLLSRSFTRSLRSL